MKSALLAATGLATFIAAPNPSVAEVTRVGVATAVNQDAQTRIPGRGLKTIAIGDEVIHNQVIDTDDGGLVQILLADGTAFTVGPNSSLTIDSFVYDPAAGTAKVSASLSKGFMRFVGGRTSKTEGGATINTPIGTAGIRGAVVDIDLGAIGQRLGKARSRKDKKGGQAGNPPHVSLIFGREVTLTANGASNRLFRAGYSVIVDGDRRSVTRTPPAFLAAMQGQLAGRDGANGGVARQPQDNQVRGSGVAQHNSGTGLPANIPVPEPRPGETPQQAVASDTRAAIVQGALGQGGTTAKVRILTARPVADDGGNGIVGGSPETDRKGTLTGRPGQDGTVSLDGGGSLALPVYADSAFTAHAISGYAFGGSTYSGKAYVGLDGFRAYMLTDGTNPLYAIAGRPTADVPGAFAASGTRHYALGADATNPLFGNLGGVIPFTYAPRFAGVDLTGAVSSDFLVAGTPGGSDPDVAARGLQAWIVIDGTGSGQKSAIGVMTGAISLLEDDVSYGFNGDRGGSDRLDASDGTTAHKGKVVSVAGGNGGSSIFGPGGQYVVLTNDPENPYSSFRDEANYPGSDQVDFSTGHVGNLASNDTSVARSYGGRTLNGFSSIALSVNGTTSARAGTVEMQFDAANATFRAQFEQFAQFGGWPLPHNEIGFADSYGGAVYLDDDNFAASGKNNRSYVVNSKVAPVKIFNGGTSSELCACSYLSWGWWGNADAGDGYTTSGHMGNWVIGDVTANIDMPVGGTATYSGNAVGTVLNGGAQYIATGTMNATMNFGARTGNVSISNFDGRNFGSDVSFAGSSTFTGTNGATDITGSFSNGGGQAAKGILGSFSTTDSAWSASGIFGGNRN
ncbi:FecR domain-containing protein [Mesorhizobium sp. ANAO-SY3R2]|uniref:FecR domain-containing protein n=1 Tax=Mesorhizobium sp. ANAO-SY3R2 TaxID=3166644 RepID=UPI00366DA941